jgi:hypothetical protein
LFIGALGVFCSVVMVVQVTRGEVPSAAVALGGATFCLGPVIPLFRTVPGRVTPRIRVDGEGTVFRPDPGIDIPMQAAVVGAVVACVLIIILLPAGKLAIPVPPHMRYSLPFMAGVLAVTGIPMVYRNLLRGSMSYLRLTPTGFELAQDWQPQRGEWASVTDVSAEVPGQKTSTPSTIAFLMTDDSTPWMAAGTLTPEGSALRDLVRFYWQHPEARDELTDGRAALRLTESLRRRA